jgi:hypothetical protein
MEHALCLMFMDPCIIVQFMKKNPTRCNNVSKFVTPYLYEAQHVSGNTQPIIRSLKLHWQPLVFYMWKVVGRCQAHTVPDSVHRQHVWQPLVFYTWKVVGRVVGGRCQAHCT